jgi:hypothetical protein
VRVNREWCVRKALTRAEVVSATPEFESLWCCVRDILTRFDRGFSPSVLSDG